MLDILKKHKVNATLFITSNYAQDKPEMINLLKEASMEGHDLANHMPEDIPYHKLSKEAFEN
jgi:peptidoglycan/xylan/chitin deacetylase (PgdA/CDA1 family)